MSLKARFELAKHNSPAASTLEGGEQGKAGTPTLQRNAAAGRAAYWKVHLEYTILTRNSRP